MSNDLEQMLMWCNRARMILSATGSKKQKAVMAFDRKLGEVRVKLQRLIEVAGESSEIVQRFTRTLDQIAVKAGGLRDVDDPMYRGEKGQNDLRVEAMKITQELTTLGNDITKHKPAKELLEEREPFFQGIAEARKRLKELGTQELANPSAVEKELGFIEFAEERVRTDPEYLKRGKCKSLMQLINGRVERLASSIKSARKLDVAQAKAKPLVEDRCGAAQRLLDEGTITGRLSPEMKETLEKTLQEIDKLCTADQWTEALKLCKKLPSAAECDKAHLLKTSALKKALPKELKLCDQTLEELGGLLHVSAIEQEHSVYNQLIAEGGTGELSPTQITALNKKILKLVNGWQSLKKNLEEQKAQLELAIVDLEKRLKRREGLLGASLTDQNARQLELVVSLRDELLFKDALQVAGTASRQLDAQRPAMEDGRAWRKVAGGAAQLATDLIEQSGIQNVSPELQAEARGLAKGLQQDAVGRLTEACDWKTLLLAYQQAQSFLKALPKRIEKFASFNDRREELDKDMAPEWEKVEQALKKVGESARKAGASPDPLLQPYRTELGQLKQGWKEWLDNTARESKSTIKGTKAGVAALLLKIDGLDDPETLASEVGKQAEAQGRKLFNEARDAFVGKELQALLRVDALKGAELKKRLEELASDDKRDEPGKPWAKRIEAVGQLAQEAISAANESKINLARGNKALAESVQSRKLELQGLREAMKKDGVDVKKFGPMFEVLEADIANLELLATTGNMTAAKVNDRLLLELSARLRNLKTLATNSSTFKDYSATIDRHTESIAELKNDGLENVAPETYTALNEQLATMQSELYGLEPKAAAETMRKMALAIEEARKQLETIRSRQGEAVLAAAECLRLVAAFAEQGFADVYRKSLESRVAAARERARVASELPAALRDFAAIKAELKEIETNPDLALKRQKGVLADEHATQKLKTEWESRLEVVNGSVLKRLRAALKSGGDDDQKAEVERMIAMAKKAVKKNKDYERGLRLLTQVEGRVAQIERNPEGTALGDRKALPKHVENYSANVIKLRQALESFVSKAVEKVTNPQRQTALRDALLKQVDPLTLQLNPGTFKIPLTSLLDKDLPDTKRREAREQALSRLRGTVGFISTHPTMVKLANNPVLPIHKDLQALDASLTRLEAHLRASVR